MLDCSFAPNHISIILRLLKQCTLENFKLKKCNLDDKDLFLIIDTIKTNKKKTNKTLKKIKLLDELTVQSFYYISNAIKNGFVFKCIEYKIFYGTIYIKMCESKWIVIITVCALFDFLKIIYENFKGNQGVKMLTIENMSGNKNLNACPNMFEDAYLYTIKELDKGHIIEKNERF